MDNITSNENVQIIIGVLTTFVFSIGALANGVALWILCKSNNVQNSKHVLMLRCLATNDIVAQFGMLILIYIKRTHIIPIWWKCVLYVCLRAFGIGSGSVALVMAVERWLALTKPFVYQKIISYRVVKRCICIHWLMVITLTYLPFVGFGQYYKNEICIRLRDATELKDIIYAYLFFVLGSTLTMCILLCNISVMFELWKIKQFHKSTNIQRNHKRSNNCSTTQEIAFVKLMSSISIIFIICWIPQMISIPVAQLYPKSTFYYGLTKATDLLLCIYFALNPYVYVLQNYYESRKKQSRISLFKRSNRVKIIYQTSASVTRNNLDLIPL